MCRADLPQRPYGRAENGPRCLPITADNGYKIWSKYSSDIKRGGLSNKSGKKKANAQQRKHRNFRRHQREKAARDRTITDVDALTPQDSTMNRPSTPRREPRQIPTALLLRTARLLRTGHPPPTAHLLSATYPLLAEQRAIIVVNFRKVLFLLAGISSPECDQKWNIVQYQK